MTERSVRALALLGTPASQRALVDFASQLSVPIDSRGAGRPRFADSVERHGILLTEDEILRQYDRYNASASLDADTQKVFGSLLDTIESLRAHADPHRTGPADNSAAMSQPIRNIAIEQAARSNRCRGSSAPARPCRRSTASRGKSPAAARRCCCWAKRAPARS